jgi:carbonic anhydrase
MHPIQQFMERRGFLKLGISGVVGSAIAASDFFWRGKPVHAAEASSSPAPALTPDAALQKLMSGNQRFIQQQLRHPDQSPSRLQEVAQAQHPFVTILSCADSRVPAEIVFDQGIGDIFDVRIAGNIATSEALGSIEYAVVLLGTPLLMVLGHERCGAVTAAVKKEALLGEIGSFVKAIQPAVDNVKGKAGDAVENAVVANVHYQMDRLLRSQLLTERIASGQLKLVGDRYDLDTGKVTLIA